MTIKAENPNGATLLGTTKVIWVEHGLAPDPITDGHIDGIAAFAAPGIVLLHSCDLRGDPNYAICNAAKRVLEQATDAKGRRLEVIDLPLGDDRAHMNFYICNGDTYRCLSLQEL